MRRNLDRRGYWHHLLWIGLLLWLAGAAGCGLLGAPEPTPAPAMPATPAPSAAPQASVTPDEVVWQPFPTPPSAPALAEVIELAGPPAPGLGPTDVALAGEWLYTANEESANLSAIRDDAVRSVSPLEPGPHRLIADPAGGQVYILNRSGRSVTVVAGDRIVARWDLPGEPTAGALIQEQLWVGLADGRITRLDVETGQALTPEPAPMQGMIQDLAAAGNRVLAASHLELALYDAQSLQQVASQPVAGYRALAIADAVLYLCTDDLATGASWLERWDLSTLAPLGRLAAPDDAGSLWVDQDQGLAVLAGVTTHRLYLLDLRSGALLRETRAGLVPRGLAYDASSERLYVALAESHAVAALRLDDLAITEVIPTALQITALAAGPEPGSLLVGLNTGEIRLLRRQGPTESWRVAVYPQEITYLPALDRAAVLDRAAAELLLVDRQGAITHRYATGPNPRGLYVDAAQHTLYAGDLRLNWVAEPADTLSIPTGLADAYPPVGVFRDTRRDRLYAIHWNGIPGSNGGYEITRADVDGWDAALPAPGRLSVMDALYDERADRFYSTHAHMGRYGLQISVAETGAEEVYVELDRYPQAMLLNAELWRLWLALPAAPAEPAHTRLLALDTRRLAPAALIEIPDRIARMALDTVTLRLYLAAGDEPRIYVLQDVALPAPPAATAAPAATASPRATATYPAPPTATPPPTTQAPPPTAMPTPTTFPAIPTATAAPTPTLTCGEDVHPGLRAAWQAAIPGAVGCPLGPARQGQWGWQALERGEMFWFSETNQILVLYSDGAWTSFDDQWREGMPELSCPAAPPPGLWQPIRGFGLAWCERPGMRERLGWALGSEEAFESLFQAFSGGALITHPRGGVFWLDQAGAHRRILPATTP